MKCCIEDEIVYIKNNILIKIIDIHLDYLNGKRYNQIGGGLGEDLANERVGHFDSVFGNFGSVVGGSVTKTILDGVGDGIKSAIGATIGIFPGGGTAFEIVTTVDEYSTLAMLQFINSFPIFFRSYFEFLHVLKDVDSDLKQMSGSVEKKKKYFDSIKSNFELANLAKSLAFGEKHRQHGNDTQGLLSAQFRNSTKTPKKTEKSDKNKTSRMGNYEIIGSIYDHATQVDDFDEKLINEIKAHQVRDIDRIVKCFTKWNIDSASREEWQTFSFQLQEYLKLRSAFQENAEDTIMNAFRRSILKVSVTTEKVFEQGILGSGVIMAFALTMINNIDVYKNLCMVSLMCWINICKSIIGEAYTPPNTDDDRTSEDLKTTGGFACLDDFMKATEIKDTVILTELHIYPQLNDVEFLDDAIKQIIITNMRFISLCYRIFKVMNDIKERPFDTAIGVLQAMFEVASNIMDIIDGEVNKGK